MRPRLFRLEAFFEEFEHVPGMFVLGSSDAQTLSVGELLEMSDVPLALEDIPLSYQDVKGDESLRAVVAEMYQTTTVRAENVLITNGASEAIFLSLHALLEPGDEAMICRPIFQSVYEVVKMGGGHSMLLRLRGAGRFPTGLGRCAGGRRRFISSQTAFHQHAAQPDWTSDGRSDLKEFAS